MCGVVQLVSYIGLLVILRFRSETYYVNICGEIVNEFADGIGCESDTFYMLWH